MGSLAGLALIVMSEFVTGFATAFSFLTSGFALVLAIIFAGIGVIVLLKNHWDDVVKWIAPGIESMKAWHSWQVHGRMFSRSLRR